MLHADRRRSNWAGRLRRMAAVGAVALVASGLMAQPAFAAPGQSPRRVGFWYPWESVIHVLEPHIEFQHRHIDCRQRNRCQLA
jgi:hypothetical protein